MALSAIAINCTLRRSGGEPSSTDKMIGLVAGELGKHGVELRETIRIADHDIKPGVSSDEGDGDAWPDIRKRILGADILIFGTPIWLGQPSSLAKEQSTCSCGSKHALHTLHEICFLARATAQPVTQKCLIT